MSGYDGHALEDVNRQIIRLRGKIGEEVATRERHAQLVEDARDRIWTIETEIDHLEALKAKMEKEHAAAQEAAKKQRDRSNTTRRTT